MDSLLAQMSPAEYVEEIEVPKPQIQIGSKNGVNNLSYVNFNQNASTHM